MGWLLHGGYHGHSKTAAVPPGRRRAVTFSALLRLRSGPVQSTVAELDALCLGSRASTICGSHSAGGVTNQSRPLQDVSLLPRTTAALALCHLAGEVFCLTISGQPEWRLIVLAALHSCGFVLPVLAGSPEFEIAPCPTFCSFSES